MTLSVACHGYVLCEDDDDADDDDYDDDDDDDGDDDDDDLPCLAPMSLRVFLLLIASNVSSRSVTPEVVLLGGVPF